MGKRKGKSGSGEGRYTITQANLDRKGKTNKKLKSNPMASKYLTAFGRKLKEEAEAKAKAEYKTGRKTRAKERRAAEEAARRAEEAKKQETVSKKPFVKNKDRFNKDKANYNKKS